MFELLRLVPKNHLSFLVGKAADIPVPLWLRERLYGGFSKAVGINLAEASLPLTAYRTFNSFFVRDLVPHCRPVLGEFVYPVDGVLRSAQMMDHNSYEQVKGKRYTVNNIIGPGPHCEEESQRFTGGTMYLFSLPPRHYHHVHAPSDARIRRCDYIPGALWPVNDWSIRSIADLFSVNERLNMYLSTPWGEVLLVMVGATNVGKLSASFDDFPSGLFPLGDRDIVSRSYDNLTVQRGERVGTFHLGSTVLLFLEKAFRRPVLLDGNFPREVRYGEVIP